MKARGGARGALASRHVVVSVLLLSLAVGGSLAGEKQHLPKWRSERILIVGIPSFEVGDWTKYLERKKIEHRYDERTHTMYVNEDPLPILEEADREEGIAQTVKRGFLERKLEAQLRGEFPGVVDPRVCLAFPSATFMPVEDDSEPVAMILAGGLRGDEKDRAKELVADVVDGLPVRNVILMTGPWRPWPGYGGEMEMRTPKKSVAITQTASAER